MPGADKHRSLLLLSGSNDRAVHAIARAAVQCGEDFRAIAWGADDRLLRGRYREKVGSIRGTAALSAVLLAGWLANARRHAADTTLVVVPSSEYLNTFLLTLDAQKCVELGIVVPLVDRDLYARLTNKESATALCARAGLRTPRELPGFQRDQLPLVAKPRCNVTSDGRVLYPLLLHTQRQLEDFLRDERAAEYFPQEFVRGSSRYLLAYFASGGDIFVSSQINRAQQPHGKSVLLARTDDFHESETAQATLALLRELRFTGFVMIEFIVDADGPCFIEVNPRPWGPLQLCVDHRCGIVEAFLGDVLHDDPWRFHDVWKNKPLRARYLWLGGILQTLRSRDRIQWAEPSAAHWLEVASSLGSDVYLRQDSWRVLLKEARTA